jgi:prepilin peptidase CpaA
MVARMEVITLLILLTVSMVIDMRERRIPNLLICIGILSGLIFIILQLNDIAVLSRLSAFFIGIAILIIPFALGGIGAGDVKLLGVIGLFVGTRALINASLISFILGGVCALGMLIVSRIKQFKSISTVCVSFFNSLMTKQLLLGEEGKLALPFSIPIGIGTFVVVVFKWSIF